MEACCILCTLLKNADIGTITFMSSTTSSIESSDWVTCPICGETDMHKVTDRDGNALITCVNHNCASNGGTNMSYIESSSPVLQRYTEATSAMDEAHELSGTLAQRIPTLIAQCESLNSKVSELGLEAFALKPMATAPRLDSWHKVLVLDEWTEMGESCRGWALVYWLEAFDGRPAGWYGNHCCDLRNPQGWIVSTATLPTR